MDLRLLAHAARRSDPELCGLWGLLHHAWDRVWGEDNLSLLRYLTDTYSIQCQAAGPAIWHSVLGAALDRAAAAVRARAKHIFIMVFYGGLRPGTVFSTRKGAV